MDWYKICTTWGVHVIGFQLNGYHRENVEKSIICERNRLLFLLNITGTFWFDYECDYKVQTDSHSIWSNIDFANACHELCHIKINIVGYSTQS